MGCSASTAVVPVQEPKVNMISKRTMLQRSMQDFRSRVGSDWSSILDPNLIMLAERPDHNITVHLPSIYQTSLLSYLEARAKFNHAEKSIILGALLKSLVQAHRAGYANLSLSPSSVLFPHQSVLSARIFLNPEHWILLSDPKSYERPIRQDHKLLQAEDMFQIAKIIGHMELGTCDKTIVNAWISQSPTFNFPTDPQMQAIFYLLMNGSCKYVTASTVLSVYLRDCRFIKLANIVRALKRYESGADMEVLVEESESTAV